MSLACAARCPPRMVGDGRTVWSMSAAGGEGGRGGRPGARDRHVEGELEGAPDPWDDVAHGVEEVGQGRRHLAPKSASGGVLAGDECHRDNGAGIHCDDRRVDPCAEAPRLAGDDEGREVVGDDHGGPAGQPLERRGRGRRGVIASRPLEKEPVGNPAPREVGGQVRDRLQNEGVDAVTGPGIVGAESLVDDQREPELVGALGGEVERGIVPRAHGGLDPVQHELAGHGPGAGAGVDSMVGGEGRRHLRGVPRWEPGVRRESGHEGPRWETPRPPRYCRAPLSRVDAHPAVRYFTPARWGL